MVNEDWLDIVFFSDYILCFVGIFVYCFQVISLIVGRKILKKLFKFFNMWDFNENLEVVDQNWKDLV